MKEDEMDVACDTHGKR